MTDLTPNNSVMDPDDVPNELVEVGVMAIMDATPTKWEDASDAARSAAMQRHASDVRSALAATLPMYGAAVIVRGGTEHYARQERLAISLTTKVARATMILQLADEAQGTANQGIERDLNQRLADMLRARARREGAA